MAPNSYQQTAPVAGNLNERSMLNVCKTIGLPLRNSYILANYAQKLQIALKGKESIPEILRIMAQIKMLYGVPGDVSLGSYNIMQKRVKEVQEKLIEYNMHEKVLLKKANRRAKLLGTGLSLTLFAQLAFIVEGTFNTYSWDVIEPISYQLSLINMSAALGWYYMYLENDDKQDPTDWMRATYLEK